MKQASERVHIKYSSAKTIIQTYKTHGRIKKKLTRAKKQKRVKPICLPAQASLLMLSPYGLSQQSLPLPQQLPALKLPSIILNEHSTASISCSSEIFPKFCFVCYSDGINKSYMEKITRRRAQKMLLSKERTLPLPKRS